MRLLLLLVACSAFVKPTAKPKKVVETVVAANAIAKEKQQSLQFQMLRSSNRVDVFLALNSLIKTKTTVKSGFSTKKDVTDLLGEPNHKTKANQYIYTLNPSVGCIAVIEFDDKGFTNCSVIKNCN